LKRKSIPLTMLAILAAVTLGAPTALAQNPTSGSDRLFLQFIEDATVIDSQWWEGQLEYADADEFDAWIARGVVALQIRKNIEIGGRVGFGKTDSKGDLPDGNGATDLDAFAKYYFKPQGNTEFAAGGFITVPTGDETAGLGTDSFAVSGFGAVRYKFERWIFSGNLGMRFNDDGMILGTTALDGKTSVSLGAGGILPVADDVTVVGEARFESRRFDGGDEDVRILGGVNWRAFNRGMIRAAISIGLSDGAPDYQIIGGYAFSY